jgi:hypothetical protein
MHAASSDAASARLFLIEMSFLDRNPAARRLADNESSFHVVRGRSPGLWDRRIAFPRASRSQWPCDAPHALTVAGAAEASAARIRRDGPTSFPFHPASKNSRAGHLERGRNLNREGFRGKDVSGSDRACRMSSDGLSLAFHKPVADVRIHIEIKSLRLDLEGFFKL